MCAYSQVNMEYILFNVRDDGPVCAYSQVNYIEGDGPHIVS